MTRALWRQAYLTRMPNIIIVGTQWGDEGKGKIVDFLTEQTDVVVRAQGGANAGHTVYNEGQKYVLHLMPSGILWPGKECVIGNGVVIDPLAFIAEIDGLEEKGIPVTPEKLRLSNAAHVVFPHHRGMDLARENKRGTSKIGTTGRGIGPAYADKIHRCGIRVNDLIQPERLKRKYHARMAELDGLLDGMDLPSPEETLKSYTEAGQRLARMSPIPWLSSIRPCEMANGSSLKVRRVLISTLTTAPFRMSPLRTPRPGGLAPDPALPPPVLMKSSASAKPTRLVSALAPA